MEHSSRNRTHPVHSRPSHGSTEFIGAGSRSGQAKVVMWTLCFGRNLFEIIDINPVLGDDDDDGTHRLIVFVVFGNAAINQSVSEDGHPVLFSKTSQIGAKNLDLQSCLGKIYTCECSTCDLASTTSHSIPLYFTVDTLATAQN